MIEINRLTHVRGYHFINCVSVINHFISGVTDGVRLVWSHHPWEKVCFFYKEHKNEIIAYVFLALPILLKMSIA